MPVAEQVHAEYTVVKDNARGERYKYRIPGDSKLTRAGGNGSNERIIKNTPRPTRPALAKTSDTLTELSSHFAAMRSRWEDIIVDFNAAFEETVREIQAEEGEAV